MTLVAAGPRRYGVRNRSSSPDIIVSNQKDPLQKYGLYQRRYQMTSLKSASAGRSGLPTFRTHGIRLLAGGRAVSFLKGASILAATQVYVLYMPSRRQHMEQLMKAWGFEAVFVQGPDAAQINLDTASITEGYKALLNSSPVFIPEAKIACHLGHLDVLRRFVEGPTDKRYALVFEDDLDDMTGKGDGNSNFSPEDVQEDLCRFFAALPFGADASGGGDGFDFVYLGFLWERPEDESAAGGALGDAKLVYRSRECLGRHAYLVTRPTARMLLEETLPMWNHGDRMYSDLIARNGLRAFRPKDPIFRQDRERFLSSLRRANPKRPTPAFRPTRAQRKQRPSSDGNDDNGLDASYDEWG